MEWQQVLALIIGNAAVIVPLFVWNRSESRADMRHILSIIDAIQKEMKDFHGRLERHDAEFKAHVMNVERSKK